MKKQDKLKLESFSKIVSRRELAKALEIEYKVLTYNLYRIEESNKYTEFEITKKNGNTRTISAPITGIKYIQKRHANILLELYPQKNCVHAYTKQRGILTNFNEFSL